MRREPCPACQGQTVRAVAIISDAQHRPDGKGLTATWRSPVIVTCSNCNGTGTVPAKERP